MNAVREYFLLSRARQVSAALPDEARKSGDDALRLARQRFASAETLWTAGHSAEALRLMREALTEALSAARSYATTKDAAASPDVDASLVTVGLGDVKRKRVLAAESKLAAAVLPRFDDDVGRDESALFRDATRAFLSIESASSPLAYSPRSLRMRSIGRIVGTIAILLVAGSATAWAFRPFRGLRASASAHYARLDRFAAQNAVDGDPTTEWCLPDQTTGWIDLQVVPPRGVQRLRLTNGHNAHYNDRAITGYKIHVYSGGQSRKTIEGTFTFSPDPRPTTINVGVANVERIRVEVTSWHQLSGCLAEAVVE